MAERGYDFATEDDLTDHLMGRFEDFDDRGGSPALWAGELTENDLQPYADEELAIAAADLACRSRVSEVRDELRRAYESRFIEEHREQLEEIRVIERQLMEQLLAGIRW